MTYGSHNGEPCNFYGSLVNVIKVQFTRGFKVILFKCHWYNTDTKGKKIIRDFHLTSVNVNNRWYDSDPYVLATQAQQVFYIDDLKLGHPWKVVQKIQHRHVWDVLEKDDDDDDNDDENDEDDDEYECESDNSIRPVQDDNDEGAISLCREDIDPESIDVDEEIRRMLGVMGQQMDEAETETDKDEEWEKDEEEEDEEDEELLFGNNEDGETTDTYSDYD
ncbi:hypothetical protein ACFX14_013323 [Malus domestica]